MPNPEKSQNEIRKLVREYILAERNHYEDYHKRKENSVWVAIAGYLAGVSTLTAIILNANPIIQQALNRWIAVILVILSWLIYLYFLNQQQSDRKIAGQIIAACGETLPLTLEPNHSFGEDDLKSTPVCLGGRPYKFPNMIAQSIQTHSSDIHYSQANYIFPILITFLWTVAFALLFVPCKGF